MNLRTLCLLLAASTGCAPSAARIKPAAEAPHDVSQVKRALLCMGNPCGFESETRLADGTYALAFDQHDNGRGPGATATMQLSADGMISRLEAHGHQEMNTRLDETFQRTNGHATWTSTNEHGELDLRGPAFYLPQSSIDVDAYLLAALLAAPGHTLALLPGGQAHLEKVGETTVSAQGQSKHLTAYAISGVGLTPYIVWANDDQTLFGKANPWQSELPEAWTSVGDILVEKGKTALREMDREVARRYAHAPPASGVALTHARVLDVERGRWGIDETVLIVGDTIQAVGPTKTVKIPAGAETIDLAGKAVLPGLWDMHAHLGDEAGVLDIASGVTTVRDVGNAPDSLDDYKKRYDEGARRADS